MRNRLQHESARVLERSGNVPAAEPKLTVVNSVDSPWGRGSSKMTSRIPEAIQGSAEIPGNTDINLKRKQRTGARA
jgi:hypothetical protein